MKTIEVWAVVHSHEFGVSVSVVATQAQADAKRMEIALDTAKSEGMDLEGEDLSDESVMFDILADAGESVDITTTHLTLEDFQC